MARSGLASGLPALCPAPSLHPITPVTQVSPAHQWPQSLLDTQDHQAFGHPTAREQWASSLRLMAGSWRIIVLTILSGRLMGRRLPQPGEVGVRWGWGAQLPCCYPTICTSPRLISRVQGPPGFLGDLHPPPCSPHGLAPGQPGLAHRHLPLGLGWRMREGPRGLHCPRKKGLELLLQDE